MVCVDHVDPDSVATTDWTEVAVRFPMATHDVTAVHEILEKDPGAGPLPNVVTGRQVPPARISAKPELAGPVRLPTATHEDAVTHETAVNTEEAPEGTPGGTVRVVKCQVELSSVATRGSDRSGAPCSTYSPTAVHEVADTQETPSSPEEDHPGPLARVVVTH